MIDTKTSSYKSHKHKYNVYVELNTKTKLGKDLLGQYHEQTKRQYMDIGRIGYHDEYGRYKINTYTIKELIVVPKLIISVTRTALDRAGKDVYKLRTYMSKFGQLNFLLLVDRGKAELILVENIYVTNINHKEDYESTIFTYYYSNVKPVPLKEIFYKFSIQANPDDYGQAWKEDIKTSNLILGLATASATIKLANAVAQNTSQKTLATCLNYLKKDDTYGKKILKAYTQKVESSESLKTLPTAKLESTLNSVLLKTIEEHTTKDDLKDKTNFKLYKKVLDVQFTAPIEIKKEIDKLNTKQNTKETLLNSYETAKSPSEETENKKQHSQFENLLDKKFEQNVNIENTTPQEETLTTKGLKILRNNKNFKPANEYKDFDGNKMEINLDTNRFYAKAKKEPKLKKAKNLKALKKENKSVKKFNAECNLDFEFARSNKELNFSPKDNKKKRKKLLNLFLTDKKENTKANLNVQIKQNNLTDAQSGKPQSPKLHEKLFKKAQQNLQLENRQNIKTQALQNPQDKKNLKSFNIKNIFNQNKPDNKKVLNNSKKLSKEHQIQNEPNIFRPVLKDPIKNPVQNNMENKQTINNSQKHILMEENKLQTQNIYNEKQPKNFENSKTPNTFEPHQQNFQSHQQNNKYEQQIQQPYQHYFQHSQQMHPEQTTHQQQQYQHQPLYPHQSQQSHLPHGANGGIKKKPQEPHLEM